MELQEMLQQGIRAARAGRKAEARDLLGQVVEVDETQLKAWLWLSEVVDSLEERQICLENILTLDPGHKAARQGLAWIEAQKAATPAASPPPAAPAPQAWQDEFDNEWLCPYCAAETGQTDEICPGCGQRLLFKERLAPRRTVWVWRGIFLQIYTVFFLIAFQVGVMTIAVKLQGVPSPFPFLPAYFGLSVDQPPGLIAAVFRAYPPLLFWIINGATLYSLLILTPLALRSRGGHYLYLLSAEFLLLLGLVTILLFPPRRIKFAGGFALLSGLLQLIITLNLWDDFTFKQRRLKLKVEGGAKDHTSLYLSAREYAGRGMWAAAVIHLRRAVAKKPSEPAYRLMLASAYLNIRRYDLAEQSIRAVEQMAPGSPQVQALKKRLASARG
ncbi:MAG: tetratricopeptide repeat protein [Anaerolineae bacterium]